MSLLLKDANDKKISVGQLFKKFNDFPDKARDNALRAGVRSAAVVVQKEARILAPKKTKNLMKSIKVKARRTQDKNVVRFSVTAGSNKAFYAHMIEFGISPHLIKIKNKKLLSKLTKTFGTKVEHPGVKPKPFMRPAVDNTENKIVDTIAKTLQKRLDKLIWWIKKYTTY